MEFKPKSVRVIAKEQPHSDSIRVEVKDKNNEGRKVFSFNLYGTSLPEVMKFLVKAFEKETKCEFSAKIRKEVGIIDEN